MDVWFVKGFGSGIRGRMSSRDGVQQGVVGYRIWFSGYEGTLSRQWIIKVL